MKQLGNVVLTLFRVMLVGGIVGGLSLQGLLAELSQVWAAESADVYVNVFLTGGFPDIHGMTLAGQEVSRVNASNQVGGGLRVGIFPQVTERVLGVELEYFGTTGKLSAVNGSGAKGSADLTTLNSMINFVVRKPSGAVRPYGGVGIGYSSGILYRADFPGRANREVDSTPGFAYQFIGGLHWDVSTRTFLFAEYKHFETAFQWKGVALDYRANCAVGGIGWNF
jgi:opacity protein-like surface antigen